MRSAQLLWIKENSRKAISRFCTPEEALGAYLRFYLSREDFPLQLPASNGPADFVGLEVEVLNAERGKDH